MFSWVCSRCGHEVPPSKTECPFCAMTAAEPVGASAPPPPQQFQPPPQPPAPQYPPPPQQAPPPQYAQQAPPQYWQPQGPPPPQQYPQQPQYPPQYWQQPQYPPPQYAQPQYPPPPPPQPQEPPPPPPPPQQQYVPPEPPPQQYAPPQYMPPPPPPPPPVPEYRAYEPVSGPTPWPPPEEQTGRPMWLIGLLAFAGVLVIFGIAYFLMGSHGSSSAGTAAKQQVVSNPVQKNVEVMGIRLVPEMGRVDVKFVVVNHSQEDMKDLAATVTLYASTQRSEEDTVGTFSFTIPTLASGDSKEMTAPLKTDKPADEMPDDWRNITEDVAVTSPTQ